jgi:ketosteroid isomerase-like protein
MPAPATSTPEQTVNELLRALDGLDMDAIESMFADNPQGVDELSGGWRRVRDRLRPYFDWLKGSGFADINTRISDVHTEDWGDTALVTAVLDQSYSMGGEQTSLHAPTSIVLRRDGDAWRIALVHSVPLPEQEQEQEQREG